MPTLEWIGKSKVINHHQDVPFRVLERKYSFDENGQHKCIACGICQMNCPNGTIKIEASKITTEDGKTKRVLDKYVYDLGSCTFCQLCVTTCPHHAIKFTNEFEHAVYTREKLVKQLNRTDNPTENN